MKVRTDYITNSSSSSFIFGIKDEVNADNIRKAICGKAEYELLNPLAQSAIDNAVWYIMEWIKDDRYSFDKKGLKGLKKGESDPEFHKNINILVKACDEGYSMYDIEIPCGSDDVGSFLRGWSGGANTSGKIYKDDHMLIFVYSYY